MNFGEKFRYVRKLRGFSLDELSNRCGLSKTYLSQIENSKRRPSMKSLERLAKALSADAAFFLDDNATTFSELSRVSGYDPPPDIVEFFAQQKNLPYAVLAKQLGDQEIDPDFLRDLLESIKKMKSK
jgi:transcriptional regulator with XRE-family HTH domain